MVLSSAVAFAAALGASASAGTRAAWSALAAEVDGTTRAEVWGSVDIDTRKAAAQVLGSSCVYHRDKAGANRAGFVRWEALKGDGKLVVLRAYTVQVVAMRWLSARISWCCCCGRVAYCVCGPWG